LPRSSSDAIDQSSAFERNLGGGISSCDGTTAIFVFNRGPETSTVLTGIDAVAKAHGNSKRAETWSHESSVRYVLHSSGDKNRELVLTVLVFHVQYSRTVMPDARMDGEWQVTPEPAVQLSNLTGGNQPEAEIRLEASTSNSWPISDSLDRLNPKFVAGIRGIKSRDCSAATAVDHSRAITLRFLLRTSHSDAHALANRTAGVR
jgi:hypothetical protein